jgi:hypothetical protein
MNWFRGQSKIFGNLTFSIFRSQYWGDLIRFFEPDPERKFYLEFMRNIIQFGMKRMNCFQRHIRILAFNKFFKKQTRMKINRRKFMNLSVYGGAAFSFGMTVYGNGAKNTNEIDLDSYGGWKGKKLTETGFFHTEHDGKRWWFVTPEGHPFFSLGVTHAEHAVKYDELDLLNKVYGGSQDKLGEFFLQKFKEWHFNSAGYEPLPMMGKRIPYVAINWVDGPARYNQKTRVWADVFSQEFEKKVKVLTAQAVAPHVNNPYCIGYVFSDLTIWSIVHPQILKIDSYVDFMRKLENGTAGKQKYIGFLTQKYGENIELFNRIYGFKISMSKEFSVCSFSALTKNGEIDKDDEEFLNIIADHYFKLMTSEIRKLDPNHLIMGDRLYIALNNEMSTESKGVHNSVLLTAAKYLDVLSFQPFGTLKVKNYLDFIGNLTKKPVFLVDVLTVPVRPTQSGETREYEETCGKFTYDYYTNAALCNNLIGIHRCTVRDYQAWNKAFYRQGLLKNDDTEYPILVDYTKNANIKLYEMIYLEK